MGVARDSPCEKENGNEFTKGSFSSSMSVIKCWIAKLRFYQLGCKKPLASPQWKRDRVNVIIHQTAVFTMNYKREK